MITTRRSDSSNINAFESDSLRGNVALLERNESVGYKEYSANIPSNESVNEARARMQENLARLMNYDRYSEEVVDSVATETVEEVEVVAQEQSFADEDIRPTSTTMQFGDGDIDQLKLDMKKNEEEKSGEYHLNSKGKLVVVLYALVVTVILALITINTGVLASLSGVSEAKSIELDSKIQAYNAIQSEIESISNSEYVIDYAENQLGMIKG